MFPDGGCDGTASVSFTYRQLRPLGVPSEEGPAGVAGDPTVVTSGLSQLLVADLTDNLRVRLRHLIGRKDLKMLVCQMSIFIFNYLI